MRKESCTPRWRVDSRRVKTANASQAEATRESSEAGNNCGYWLTAGLLQLPRSSGPIQAASFTYSLIYA